MDMEQNNRITLIDDDQICHLISVKIIQQFSSFAVESFTSPVEALNQLKWRTSNAVDMFPDIVLLDIEMPRMNGWQFLEEFEKLPDHVLRKSSVIMLSSSDHIKDVEKSKTFKCVKYFLSKPLTEGKVKMLDQFLPAIEYKDRNSATE
jgi:CheY-like chemotaxis protein